MRKKQLAVVLAFVLTCVGVCACSSPSRDSGSYSNESMVAYDSYDASGEEGSYKEAAAGESSSDASTKSMIRRTADVQLSTRSFDDAAQKLGGLLDQYATVVLEQSEHNDSYRYSSRSLVARFRVEAAKLNALLEAIDGVDAWTVTSSQLYADDVTKQYSDTKQRIDALQVRYEWYKEQVQTTENADLAREYSNAMFDTLDEITRLENQNAELDTDVKYSVITVSLYEDTTITDIDESVGLWDEIVNEALVLPKNIAAAFGHLLLFIITVLPTLLVLGCIVGVVVLIRKAWLRKHPKSAPASRSGKPKWRPFSRKAKGSSAPALPAEPAEPAGESDAASGADAASEADAEQR